jgi:hypothetical protein
MRKITTLKERLKDLSLFELPDTRPGEVVKIRKDRRFAQPTNAVIKSWSKVNGFLLIRNTDAEVIVMRPATAELVHDLCLESNKKPTVGPSSVRTDRQSGVYRRMYGKW